MSATPYYATPEEAGAIPVSGWNLRCNRCGSYGASWLRDERPGWGSLALCPADAGKLNEEHLRHRAALAILRSVNYEQTAT